MLAAVSFALLRPGMTRISETSRKRSAKERSAATMLSWPLLLLRPLLDCPRTRVAVIYSLMRSAGAISTYFRSHPSSGPVAASREWRMHRFSGDFRFFFENPWRYLNKPHKVFQRQRSGMPSLQSWSILSTVSECLLDFLGRKRKLLRRLPAKTPTSTPVH